MESNGAPELTKVVLGEDFNMNFAKSCSVSAGRICYVDFNNPLTDHTKYPTLNFGGYPNQQNITINNLDLNQGIAEGENIAGDSEKIDTAITQFLRDIDILKEQIRVEIYNATSIQGAANKVARRLAIYGIDVVKTGNYPETVEKSGMFLAGNKTLMISNFNEIKRAFRGDILELKEYKYNYSGDIILIIGDDYQYLK